MCIRDRYNAVPVPMDADGKSPMEPEITAPSSDKMSPNKFVVTITSNCAGLDVYKRQQQDQSQRGSPHHVRRD